MSVSSAVRSQNSKSSESERSSQDHHDRSISMTATTQNEQKASPSDSTELDTEAETKEHLTEEDKGSGMKDQKCQHPDSERSDEQSDENGTAQAEAHFFTATVGQPMSKNAVKRRERWEKKMELKKRKKENEKKARWAKAALDGRDLELERLQREERQKLGEGHKRRQKILLDRLHASADNSFQVCLDCSYEERMNFREVNSLAQQIRYCYAANKRSENPVYMIVTSLQGSTKAMLEKVDGFPESWQSRGFEFHPESIEQVLDTSNLVYLTSDSPQELQDMDDDTTYVIGGIVDRNRLKRATINRAVELGIATARLPIAEYLDLFSTKVLTCNHVFEILLKYRECGKDWKKAMLEVLPPRKHAKAKEAIEAKPKETRFVADNNLICSQQK